MNRHVPCIVNPRNNDLFTRVSEMFDFSKFAQRTKCYFNFNDVRNFLILH